MSEDLPRGAEVKKRKVYRGYFDPSTDTLENGIRLLVVLRDHYGLQGKYPCRVTVEWTTPRKNK